MNALEAGRRRLGPECLSDLALDQLWTGESAGTPLESLRRSHLGRCEACARRWQDIEAAAGVLLARPEGANRLAARVLARSRRRWAWGAGATVCAGAAAVVCLLVWPAVPSETEVRLKGPAVGLSVYVKRRSGAVEALPEGGSAQPGDVLRFVVTPRQDGFVGVVGIDGAGAVNAYAPQGTELVPAKAGQALALDGGIELDQVLGRERLTVFACAERLTRAALLEPVAALVRQGRARPEKPLQVRQGCVQSSLWFEKVQAR